MGRTETFAMPQADTRKRKGFTTGPVLCLTAPMTDSTAPAPTDTENCSNCRHHTRQKRAQPLWFEAGEQMRTLDDDKDIFVCMAVGAHQGRELLEPIRCAVYSPGRKGVMTSELSQRMDAALERLKNTKDHES